MTPKTANTPLSHERTRHPTQSDLDRVDDEYVFVVAVDDPRGDDDDPLSHSLRVDPTAGDEGELLVHVTRRRSFGPDADRNDRDSVVVSVPAPNLDSPPLVRELQSVLEAWYYRHCHSGLAEQEGTSESSTQSPSNHSASSSETGVYSF
jgi:hypothetical protein